MTHQRPGEWNPPPQWDMCHSPAVSPTFFVVSRHSPVALSPCGYNDQAPICCGDPGSFSLWTDPSQRYPLCQICGSRFTFDTSVFYICDRYQSSSVPRRNVLEIWSRSLSKASPPCALVPLVKTIFLKEPKNSVLILTKSWIIDPSVDLLFTTKGATLNLINRNEIFCCLQPFFLHLFSSQCYTPCFFWSIYSNISEYVYLLLSGHPSVTRLAVRTAIYLSLSIMRLPFIRSDLSCFGASTLLPVIPHTNSQMPIVSNMNRPQHPNLQSDRLSQVKETAGVFSDSGLNW